MKAVGEHILIQKPTKRTVTDSGLALPDDMESGKFEYGRVLSVGEGAAMQDAVGEGDFVVYDPMGCRPILIDPLKDDGLLIAHITQVFTTLSREELEERKLPIP